MTASSGASGNAPTNSSGNLASGTSSVNAEISQMNAAFALATQTNMEITVAKTVDGAEETAAQQRPNIG
jgi:hypothetical protein